MAAFSKISIGDAATVLRLLGNLQPADSAAEFADWCARAADGLTEHGNRLLVESSTFERVKQGASALSTAACLYPAARALADADRLPPAARAIRSTLHDLAVETLVQAVSRMLPLKTTTIDLAAVQSRQPGASVDSQAGAARFSHIAVLDNIATYHREHERYYTVHKYESALELAREANKLRVVADAWLCGDKPLPSYPGTDFDLPPFRAAGCDDLNPLPAIATIGILFMEGQGEPAEIRTLKAKLRARGDGAVQAGEWLGGMMAAAWPRGSILFDEKYADAARPGYRTIATNWIGSLETLLSGRLLLLAVGHMNAIDFTPKAIRTRKVESAQTLALAAGILGLAANLEATSAVDLSGNDDCWTSYRTQLRRLGASDR
jgi:hypothetical protein